MIRNNTKVMAIFLAIVMLISAIPISVFAAVASDLPENMADSSILRALEYTGYDVAAQKADGTLYQAKSYSIYTPNSVLSNINYGLNLSGNETVSDNSTVTGKAPDIAKFEQYGLCCAAFVTYYICNYLPNIEGADTQFITDAINSTQMNSQAVITWQTAMNNLVNAGLIEKIGTNASNVDRSKLAPGDIIIFGNSTNSHTHIGIYSGTYKGQDFMIHVGNDNGPEINPVAWMSDESNGDKASSPNAYYHLPEDLISSVGMIEVHKRDTDGNSLAGAYFVATSTEDSSLQYVIGPTDNNGYAFIEGVKYSSYSVKETVFPVNYRSYGQSEWTVTLDKNTSNGLVSINAVNELIPGDCQIVKSSEDGNISAVKFTLTGNGINQTVQTDDSGKATIKDLKPGTYQITEQSIDKYEPQEVRTVTVISGQTATVTFNNVLKRGGLKVIKTSEDNFVEGVQFKLSGTSLSGAAVEEFAVTDKSGVATFSDVLISGNSQYVLEELNTSEKYIIPDKQNVSIEWNKVVKISVHNKLKRGALNVKKNSEDGFVSNIKFRLYGMSLSGEQIDIYSVTDENGVAKFNDVLIGTEYILEEVDTKISYVIPELQEACVKWNEITEYTFENVLKKFKVEVFKTDSELQVGSSGQMPIILSAEPSSDEMVNTYGWPYGVSQGDATLEGATYGLYYNGTLLGTYTTDKNGYFQTDYYVCGEGYYLKEIYSSNGYLVDTSEYQIDCKAEKYTVEFNTEYLDVYEDIIKGNIEIAKHTDDGGTQIGTPEVGAVFEIYLKTAGSYDNAKDGERDILEIDESGFAKSKGLPFGVYTVSQVKGWEGRDTISDFDVAILQHEHTYRYIINNSSFRSYIKIIKTDATTGKTIPYSGAGFQIYDPQGNLITMKYTYPELTVVDTFYTTANGTLITPESLPYGKGYSLVEVKANNGYVLDPKPVYFDVIKENSEIENDITVVTVTKGNIPQMGKINITKSGEVFASVTENDGVYQPVYEMSSLEGAKFSVYAAEDIVTPDGTLRYFKDEKVDTITTDSEGIATTKELYLGKYVIYEEEAPYGMLLNKDPIYVELVYSGQEVSVTTVSSFLTNERQKIELDLFKTMEQDEQFDLGMNDEITKASFALYAAENIVAKDGSFIPKDGLLEIVYCTIDGLAKFDTDIPVGSKLYVKEYTTDVSYMLSDTIYSVEFVYTDQNVAIVIETLNDGVSIENRIIRGDVEGLKLDEDGVAIEGVTFGLFESDTTEFTIDNAILISVTDKEGKFGFDDLPRKKWLIKELYCPEQYVLSDEIYTVEITSDKQVISLVVENKYVVGNVEVIKTDADTGEKLSGSIFEVYIDTNGDKKFEAGVDKLYGSLCETGVGVYRLEKLRYSGYFLYELNSPSNYVRSEEYYYFSICENGVTVQVETTIGKGFENEAYKGSIKLIKQDADTEEAISDVEFGLYDLNGNEIERGFTDEFGELVFENIRFGKYEVRELTTKEGYYNNDEIFAVEISENGQIVTLNITNKKIPDPPIVHSPQTGDTSNYVLWFSTMTISMIALTTLFIFRRKKIIK